MRRIGGPSFTRPAVSEALGADPFSSIRWSFWPKNSRRKARPGFLRRSGHSLGFGSDPAQRYEEIAVATGTPVGTLKNQVFRLRKRWRELLFEQVALTLDEPTPDEIRGELKELLSCV